MRKISLIILFSLFFLNGFSQNWQTNFEQVKVQAQTSNKNIVLVFSGSDWCAPCIKLDKDVFKSDYFQTYSKDHFILLKADFPRKKKNALPEDLKEQNRALAETYNKNGYFPLVLVLTPEGKVLGQLGFEKLSPEAYVDKLISFEK